MAAYLINMGVALQREGRSQEAVEAYRKGLALDGNWPEAHLNQAYALQDMGRHQEALDAFTNALKARPNWSRAHAGLGGILSAAGHLQQAMDHLQAAVKEDPYDEQHRLDLGQVPQLHPQPLALYYPLHSPTSHAVWASRHHMIKLYKLLGSWHGCFIAYRPTCRARHNDFRVFSSTCLGHALMHHDWFISVYDGAYAHTRQVLHARGMFDDEQQVYSKLISELGDNALAYSYWATSILAAYQVRELKLTTEVLCRSVDTFKTPMMHQLYPGPGASAAL